MQIDTIFLRSKLSRRIFVLFVLCALVPVTLLAVISFWNVNNQLREQNREELREASHENGMAIYERLTFLEADMKLMTSHPDMGPDATALPSKPESNRNRRFLGLELTSEDGRHQLLFGKISSQPALTPGELEHVRSGKSLLLTRTCDGASACVFLIRQVDASQTRRRILVAEVLPSYLLGAENILESKDVCIVDEQGRAVACSGEIPSSFPAAIFSSVVGRFQWRQSGKDYQADFWNLFLKPNFYTNHWTIIASEASDDVFAPVAHFKRIFLLVVLLALWVVLLLSLIQIRRNLVPLSELQEGTRHIARGDFERRVTIKSGDEFEDLAHSFNSMAGRIEKQFNTLQTRNAIDRAILSSWNAERIVVALLAHMRSILPYKLACVSLAEHNSPTRTMSYLSSADSGDDMAAEIIDLSGEELRELLAHPEINVIPVSDRCPRFLSPLVSRGMRFFLVVPVIVRGKLSAIVSLSHDKSPIWTEEDISHARQVADQVGVALSNAHLVADLQDLNLGTLTALARAIDAKSGWTAGHSERVTDTALKIAREMQLPQRDLDILHRGGLLHDIGKIGVSADLLDKPGRLTDEETAKVREHVEIGKRILEPIASFVECMPIVLEHHEWFDGSGYPCQLAGEEISLHARIFAVADCYDAMISDRPYRPGMPLDRVLDNLRKGSGKQFDPTVVEAFFLAIARDREMGEVEGVSASPSPVAAS
ncbi:MAG TPA: HD domain-containing phosphohydrolase [Candidatus Acidoferrales bacterium]|nr:HD domain-containing phosphohydrolase [Candidatus Acidoferrales bacterium]